MSMELRPYDPALRQYDADLRRFVAPMAPGEVDIIRRLAARCRLIGDPPHFSSQVRGICKA